MLAKVSQHVPGFFLCVFVFLGAVAFTGLGNDQTFESEKWLSSNPRDRGRMAQSLVDGETLVGHPESEVLEVLGQPERNWGKVHQYQIDLGWPFKKPTSYGLQVHYDADRNVRLVKIVD